jgi:uncharacterized membrane protein
VRGVALALVRSVPTISILIAGTFGVLLASEARAEQSVLTERSGHVTEAVITVDAAPAEVYRVVTDYAHWPTVLSDVTSVTVEAGGRRDARVRFRSRALEHEVAVVFDNDPDRTIRFRSVDAPPGARASGEYQLVAIDGGKRTQITAKFFLDVSWPTSWLIRDSKVRSMRRTKLEHDLDDVERRFSLARPPVSTAAH